jgi:hypothetical protein
MYGPEHTGNVTGPVGSLTITGAGFRLDGPGWHSSMLAPAAAAEGSILRVASVSLRVTGSFSGGLSQPPNLNQ